VVSVNLIIEAFEHVAKSPFLIMKTLAWKLYILPHFTLVVEKGVVNGKMSTSTYIITVYGPTPPSFSLTAGRKHSCKDIKLIEELSLGFLARAVTIALPLGLPTGVVAETLILLLRHLK
jgi:hypothetical protein